jgi:glyoxylase-like metal-dependent hydrolase (beta-lactamase superfamily II)
MLRSYDILGNRQMLDGGAMFGNAPRALWSRWCPPDEQGRISLNCRALLVETDSKRILFETGIGVFFPPELKDRYGVVEPQHVLLESLATRGLSDGDIDVVMLSHLHFDHAGGLLAPWKSGQGERLLFPKAKFVVGRDAFTRAKSPHPRDRASFIAALPSLLEDSGRLHLIDAGPGDASIFGTSRLSFIESFGHTPGLLLAVIEGRHKRLIFCTDLIPGVPWVHLPITMGYDRYPEQLIDEKANLFRSSDLDRSWFFFTHDSQTAAARVRLDEKGRYQAHAHMATLDGWDLDAPAYDASGPHTAS